MALILVGEDNPLCEDPRMALYHFPPYASGGRLRRILGLSVKSYLALAKRNLCRGAWNAAEARATAAELMASGASPIVMLGTNVKRAFGYERQPAFEAWGSRLGDAVLIALPHPSGRNAIWNNPARQVEARLLLRRHAPDVPWGEEDHGGRRPA